VWHRANFLLNPAMEVMIVVIMVILTAIVVIMVIVVDMAMNDIVIGNVDVTVLMLQE
jgi:hypothetical protein